MILLLFCNKCLEIPLQARNITGPKMAFRPLFGAFVITVLLIQISRGRYCQEAVNSVKIVDSCPTSKAKWDAAARKKNCSRIALQQNCTTVEQFQYHCVINGYRNETMEVCAPSRIILGHCVEFNVPGGVIQDQLSAPCNETFPKCDRIYKSTTAYIYPDCYQLVSITTTTESTPNDGLNKYNEFNHLVMLTYTALGFLTYIITLFLIKRRRTRFGRKMADIFKICKQRNESRRRESRRLLQTFEEQDGVLYTDQTQDAHGTQPEELSTVKSNCDGVLYTDQTQDAHGTQPEELSTVKSNCGPREDSPETHSLNHNALQPETDKDASDARSDDHDVLQQHFDQRKYASDNQSEELSTVQSDSDNMCDPELPTRNISPAPSSIQSASSGSTIYEDASDAKSDDPNVLEPNSDQRKDASDNQSEELSTVQSDSDNMCDTELPTRNISPAPSSIQSASSGSTIYEDASDAKSDDPNVLEPNSDQRKDASDNQSEKLSTVQLDSDQRKDASDNQSEKLSTVQSDSGDTQEEHQLEKGSHDMKEEKPLKFRV